MTRFSRRSLLKKENFCRVA